MTEHDRQHWDRRWTAIGVAPADDAGPPPLFAGFDHLFPTQGLAFEIACGRGRGAVWLASRGLEVVGVDVSPVAVTLAEQLAERKGVADRCHFHVHDLDRGLPPGPPVDVLVSYLFWDDRLVEPIKERLGPRGLVAIAALSEVGAGPGRFRVRPGALTDAFHDLPVHAAGEADGYAWLVAGGRPA